MSDPNAPIDDDELLTSYLDGELGEEERRFVQHRLMDDAALRQKLSDLQQAWDLLDDLPESTSNQEFTKSTLELVTLGVEKGWEAVTPNRKPPNPWLRGIRLIGILLSCGFAVGLLSGAIVRTQNRRDELRRLDLVAYLPGLKAVESMEVIRAIASLPDLELVVNKNEIFEDRVFPVIPTDLNARVAWVEGLNQSQKSLLYSHDMQLRSMRPEDHDQLQKLSQEIAKEPESHKFNLALGVVGALYDERANDLILLKTNTDVPRIDRIRQAFYRKLGEWYFQNLEKRDREESEVIRSWYMGLFQRDPTLAPYIGELLRYSRNDSMRRACLRELLHNASGEVRHLISGEYVNNAGKSCSELAQRILFNLDPSDRAILLADCIDELVFFGDLSLDEVYQVYSKWDREARDASDLGSYEDIKARVRSETRRSRIGPRPDRGNREPNKQEPNKQEPSK